MLIACAGGTRGLLAPPDEMTGGGRSSGASALIGVWETTLLVTTEADTQLWTTEWTFRADGTCRFRQLVFSVLADRTDEEVRTCRWTESFGVASVRFDDSGESLMIPFSFPGGLSDRMIFEGFEYRRIG